MELIRVYFSSFGDLPPLSPGISLLASAFCFTVLALGVDAVIGDPVYRWHPIRVLGNFISGCEKFLRKIGGNGIGSRTEDGEENQIGTRTGNSSGTFSGIFGGFLLVILTVSFFLALWILPRMGVALVFPQGVMKYLWVWDLFWAVSLLAYKDLISHVLRVNRAANEGDLERARFAVSCLVGRDTERLTAEECRRAAMESLAENWIDGVLAPVFFLAVAGVPGLIVFKAVSTLDSMVGYRNPRYEKFGKASARLDDLLCWIPARLGFLLLCVAAVFVPGASARGAWSVGLSQHGVLPGPNPGWSEAAAAGALRRRLIGPIDKDGVRVTEVWVGMRGDPPAGSSQEVHRLIFLTVVATGLFLLSMAAGLAGCLVWEIA
jgi:adenosylcobinamide-phosphate synthase